MKKRRERKSGFVLHGSCARPSWQCPKLHELHSQADVCRQWTQLTMWGAVLGTAQPWHFAHALSLHTCCPLIPRWWGRIPQVWMSKSQCIQTSLEIDDACVCVWSVKNINIPCAHSISLQMGVFWTLKGGEEERKSLSVNSSHRLHY